MANEVSIYEPRTMGRVVQKLPPVRTFFRSTFFRHEETFTTKPFFCTVSCQRLISAIGSEVSTVHLFFATEIVSLFVKEKSITSFTPSPMIGIAPVKIVCAHISSSRLKICSLNSLKAGQIWQKSKKHCARYQSF